MTQQQKQIDTSRILLDDAGRFEIDPEHLVQISGGRTIIVIRGTKCRKENTINGDVIRSSHLTSN